MKHVSIYSLRSFGLLFIVLAIFTSCTETTDSGEASASESAETEQAPEKPAPLAIEAASFDFADRVKTLMNDLQNFDFDKFGEGLSDEIQWNWPDGGSETRTIIKGKDNLVGWWKNWEATSGVDKLEFSETNYLPIQINGTTSYYNAEGTAVLAYVDAKLTKGSESVIVQQHLIFMFDTDNKVNRVVTFYDRSGLTKLFDVDLKAAGQ